MMVQVQPVDLFMGLTNPKGFEAKYGIDCPGDYKIKWNQITGTFLFIKKGSQGFLADDFLDDIFRGR